MLTYAKVGVFYEYAVAGFPKMPIFLEKLLTLKAILNEP